MEKFKIFLRSLPLWKLSLFTGLSLTLLVSVFFVSRYLQRSAKLMLGSDTGLTLTADRQDSLGAFSDTTFTLKSDQDLTASAVKDSVVFFPEIEYDVNQISSRQYNIAPKSPLKNNSLYRIKVLSNQKTFSWAFQTKNDFRVVQTLPRDRATYVPLNTGIEITFSHDNWEDIGWKESNFEITPFVEGRFERHKRTLSFIPKSLAPDTLYTVKVKKGLSLKGSTEVLKDDFIYRFETQSASGNQSQLNFSRNFYEFSLAEKPAFDIYSSSGGGADISVKVFQYPSIQGFVSDLTTKLSIPVWATNSLRLNRLVTSNLNKILDFNTPITTQTYNSFFLLPQTLPKGLYLVEANIGGGGGITTQAMVQVTDLSAYLSVSGTKTLVWVNDISSKNSVSGAKVGFAGQQQVTGTDGIAYFDTPLSQLKEGTDTVTVEAGDNFLILPSRENNYYGSEYQKTRRQTDKYWSYFYTDRPVYLPGDSLKFWGLLRDRDNLSQKQKFTLEVTRSDYNSWNFTPVMLFAKDLETSDLGTFIGDIPLANYNPGWYGITAKIGETTIFSSSFSVETYTKPAYKLTLNPSKNAAIFGETVTYSGNASFFEGSPVPGMDLKFTGGKNGNVTTDSFGHFSFTDTPSLSQYGNYFPQYSYVSIMPSLPEEGGIGANTSVAVFNSSLVFGSSKSETKDKTGRVEVNLRQVDTTKYTPYAVIQDVFAPATGRAISGEVQETLWNRREVGTYYDFINKVTSPRYEYDRIQNKIADITLNTDGQGKAVYEFPVADGKSYNIVLRATDDQGRTTSQDIYVYGSAKNNYPNTNLFLKSDKVGSSPNTYATGEQVNLTLNQGESPLETKSSDRFLYLFAQRGLKSYQISKDSHLNFKYSDTFVPNIVVMAVRFTGQTYQVSENLYLLFDTSSKKLSLDVTQDKPSYLPGDTAKLSILAKDQGGSGVQAEVNLNLIDEAYNTMYSTTIDPLSRIYSSLDPDIIASYQSHRYPLDFSGAEGGGCFLPGTQILLGTGKSKAIEDIKVGDFIKTLQDPLSNKLIAAKVIKTFQHQVAGFLVINNHLRVTGEHNLYINGRWMTASEVKIGDSYLDTQGDYQRIYSIENRSGINTVYNFTVEKLSTYFADGFYVHNDKGRELFVDNAFFGSVRTGSDGRATLDVKLPDNLTSWRITSQGITGDLKAGIDSSLLAVKQPFFVDLVTNTEYLVGERPQILVRAYGDSLSAGSDVSIRVQAESLGLDKSLTIKAFESTKIDLGELKEGTHKITVSGQTGNLSDKLIRSIRVVKSRLQVTKSANVSLTSETKLVGSANSVTSLVFSDFSLGRYFPPLSDLAYTWGDRLDQRLARTLSQEIIKKSFDDSVIPEKLDLSAFQSPNGGYSLFPYSSPDLELSAYTAALAKDRVSTVGLANYFYQQFSNAKDSDTASISLFGLASLDEPVLLLINNLSEVKDLTPLSRIYLSLAQAKIGDTEKALTSYSSLMSEFGEKQDQFTFLKIGSDKDSYLQATALTSALASLLGASETDSLLAYTLANTGKDILLVSPQLLTISNQLSNLKPQSVSFAYTLNGKKTTKKLEKGQVYKMDLSSKDLSEITFSDISGPVSLASFYLSPLDPESAQVNSSIHIGRSYSVKGRATNTFSSSDLIKISLPVTYADISQDGCYQVSDLLPSGLKPITSVYSLGLDYQNIWYPYEINGQKISFCIGKGNKDKTINYYARVVTAGDYKAESALIQSLISPSVYNLSPAGTVLIK